MIRSKVVATKTSDPKKDASVSRSRKTGSSPVIDSPIAQILFLQSTVGNQAVENLLKNGALQSKPTSGKSGELPGRNADPFADQKNPLPESSLKQKPASTPPKKDSAPVQSVPLQETSRVAPGKVPVTPISATVATVVNPEVVAAKPDAGVAAAPVKAGEGKPHGTSAETESQSFDREGGIPEIPEGGRTTGPVDTPLKLHMPKPPAGISPATQRRIRGVQARAGSRAVAHGALPSGASQVGAARQAVTEPDAEAVAKAQAELINQVQAAASPEIVKLCERIREVIRNKRPPDEDALMEAKPEEEALNAGNQLNATVQGEAGKVQDHYGELNNPPTAVATKGRDLPPQPPLPDTPPLNATVAVPDAVPPGNVSLNADAADSSQKMRDAGMDTPAAQLAQSGPVAEARGAQSELEQVAKEDPAKVLAGQKVALTQAEGDMAALQAQALTALTNSRVADVKSNSSRQKGMVASEESLRAKAGAEAQKAFNDAQSQVAALLQPLASNAMAEWEAAKEVLVSQFKADLAIVQKRVEERHSGVGGFFVGLWDAVTGLPGWAEDAYTKAETNFGDGVIAKLTTISANVNSVIAACDLIIKNARNRIAKIFSDLPESLNGWALQEQAKFDGQLDQLHIQVIAARDRFNKDLVERSSQAVDEVRTEIAELRKKAGGLVGRIVSAVNRFLEDPVKFIIEGLLDLLGISPAAFWAVVAKIRKFVKEIADDPLTFADNLLKGLGQGFSQFFDNILSHLLKGFISWLTGGLGNVGVQLPKDLSLKSIITFFLQLMGITWPRIRKILAKHVGEKNVALLEKVYSLVSFLIEKGPEGIYEMIKEKLDPQAIVDQIVQLAVDFLIAAVVKAVSARIILLFNPVGAILQALEAIYRVLKWIFQNAARIFTLIETVVNGIGDILAGSIGGFANAVEKALGMLIAPVISFLADYLGFGDLPAKIAEKIKSFQEWILGLIEKALVWIIEKGKALLAAAGLGGKDKDKKGTRPDEEGVGESIDFEGNGESHRLWIAVHGRDAEVMVASRSQTLGEYLDDVAREAGNDPVAGPHIRAAREILGRLGPDADKLAVQLAKRAAAEDEAAAAGTDDVEVAQEQTKVKGEQNLLVEHLKIIFELLNPIQNVIGENVDKLERAPFGYQFTTVEKLKEIRRAGGFGAADEKRFPTVHTKLDGTIALDKGPSRYDLGLIEEFRRAVEQAKDRLDYDEAPTFDGNPESLVSRLETSTGERAIGSRRQMQRFIAVVIGGDIVTGAEVDIGVRRSVDHTLLVMEGPEAIDVAVEYKHWTGHLSQYKRKKLYTRLREQLSYQVVLAAKGGRRFKELRIEWPEFHGLDNISQANFLLVMREAEGMGRMINVRVRVFSKPE